MVLDNYQIRIINLVYDTGKKWWRYYIKHYEAPEVKKNKVTVEAQIYSLGCILYEMSTLKGPVDEKFYIKTYNSFKNPVPIPHGKVSSELKQIIHRMM